MAGSPSGQKGKLTLAQLASYDDILTDTLVDRVSLLPLHAIAGKYVLILSALPGLLLD